EVDLQEREQLCSQLASHIKDCKRRQQLCSTVGLELVEEVCGQLVEPHLAIAVVIEQIELRVEEQAAADATAGNAEIELGRRPQAGIENQLRRILAVARIAGRRVIVNEETIEQQERIAEAAIGEIAYAAGIVTEGKVDIERGIEIDRHAERHEDREERRELALKLKRRHVIGQERDVVAHQQPEDAGWVLQDVELERLGIGTDTVRLGKVGQDVASNAGD